MNPYETFLETELRRMEQTIADARAGKIFWCADCGRWLDIKEKGQNMWGGDWPCGQSASVKWRGMWFCAEHWDWHEKFCAEIKVDPVFGKEGNEQ
jgi:hypothetical protein